MQADPAASSRETAPDATRHSSVKNRTALIEDIPLSGVWAAALTPMNQDLSVDHGRLNAHISWLFERGCHGVVLLGTTGEANSLSVSERLELLEHVAASGIQTERCIAGTGSCALPEATLLTRRATELGYRAVLLLPPFYYKQIAQGGLFDFVRRVIADVSLDALRIMLYHIPAMAGVGWSVELIRRLRADYPDQIVAIKDSSGHAASVVGMCRELPDFRVFAGSERLMRACLSAGGAGCVSASANVTSAIVRTVHDEHAALPAERPPLDGPGASDHLLPLESKMLAFRAALEAGPMIPVLKRLMAERTKDASWENVRPPHEKLDRADVRTLEAALSELPELPNFV